MGDNACWFWGVKSQVITKTNFTRTRGIFHICKEHIPDFSFSSTLSFPVTQLSTDDSEPCPVSRHFLHSFSEPRGAQVTHWPTLWLQFVTWMLSKLPLHMQVSHAWSPVLLSLFIPEFPHMSQREPSCKCAVHLMQDIVPLLRTLHAAVEMFLRHQVQWRSILSAKSTGVREKKKYVTRNFNSWEMIRGGKMLNYKIRWILHLHFHWFFHKIYWRTDT